DADVRSRRKGVGVSVVQESRPRGTARLGDEKEAAVGAAVDQRVALDQPAATGSGSIRTEGKRAGAQVELAQRRRSRGNGIYQSLAQRPQGHIPRAPFIPAKGIKKVRHSAGVEVQLVNHSLAGYGRTVCNIQGAAVGADVRSVKRTADGHGIKQDP